MAEPTLVHQRFIATCRRWIVLVLTGVTAGVAAAQPSGDVDEPFTWTQPGVLAEESSTNPRLSSDSGLRWRGHAAGGTIVAADNHTLQFSDGANEEGSYAFTILDEASPPVDLTRYGATIKIFVNHKAAEQQLRWLVRDVAGSWYISSATENPIPEGSHKGFPPQVYTWLRVALESEDHLNQMEGGVSAPLQFGPEEEPDLSAVTGIGLYVARGGAGSNFIVDWLQLHEYEPLVTYCPEYSTHEVETDAGVRWGFSALGGGSSGAFYIGDGHNLNAPGWGRAFQSAFRSRWHNGDYNPTQGGRTDTYGAATPMTYVVSSTGDGTRVEYGPFQVPTMGRGLDLLTYHDLTNGKIPGGYDMTPGSDNDGIDESNRSERDEVLTEFWMEGFYEDVSGIVSDDGVSALRIYQQYDYRDEPYAILQFGENAITDDGKPILNESYREDDISLLLDGDQPSTPIDPAHLLFFWGDRIDRNHASYNWFWWPDESGEWISRPLDTKRDWQRTPDDGPRLTLLASSPDDPNSDAIGLYYPEWSRYNRFNIAGVETASGRIVYEEDRNMALRWRASWRTTGRTTTKEGCTYSNRFNKRDFGLVLRGVLAPEHGLPGVHERIRFEAFHLVGTPNSIAEAVEEIEANFCAQSGECIPSGVAPIDAPRSISDLTIYPNPAADWLRVGYPEQRASAQLAIMDVQGRRVLLQTLNGSGDALVDVSGLAGGIYFVNLLADGVASRDAVIIAR